MYTFGHSTKIDLPRGLVFFDSYGIPPDGNRHPLEMNDYEVAQCILDLFEIKYIREPDTNGNPFWVSSRRRDPVHFHLKFSVDGTFLDAMIGRWGKYCTCPWSREERT